jgi:hypothetical protein
VGEKKVTVIPTIQRLSIEATTTHHLTSATPEEKGKPVNVLFQKDRLLKFFEQLLRGTHEMEENLFTAANFPKDIHEKTKLHDYTAEKCKPFQSSRFVDYEKLVLGITNKQQN